MPSRFLKKLGADLDNLLHDLSEQSSIANTSLEYLRERVSIPGEEGDALKDATIAAERVVELIRKLQDLIG